MARDLHVTSPAMSGPDVRDVQNRLVALGYAPGELDGAYGLATAGAVRAFQRDHALDVDGVVGAVTLAALDRAGPAPRATPSARGRAALAEALKHLGVAETPPGSNRTPFGTWFGVDGVAWCNIFVSYCFAVGANYTIASGFAGRAQGVYPKGCTYVPTTEAWLRVSGMWLGRVEPQPGDIAIYNWDGREPDHIGIVERYLGNGSFIAIEGNTAIGNDANGDQVMRRTRTLNQVDGFGRVSDS
jgi:hypothetical protein